MAYISYDRAPPRSAGRDAKRPRNLPFAWGPLLAIVVSLLSWVGIIAAVRAVFF